MSTVTQNGPITRADIESKLREIRGGVDATAQAAKPVGLAVGMVAAVAVIGAVYLLGRRRGQKRSAVVEIRRV